MRPLRTFVATRPAALRAAVPLGLALALAASVPAREAAAGRGADPSGVRITASLREVRVVFPRDTARAWGWSDDPRPRYFAFYHWMVATDGVDGPESLTLAVMRLDGRARAFPSLAAVVAEGEPRLCTFAGCVKEGVEARVEDGRLVLAVRDSAAIARWLGLRPDSVRVAWNRPGETMNDSYTVPVEYVAPAIPPPDAALLARSEVGRRLQERAMHRRVRRIDDGRSPWLDLWLAVGDTVPLWVSDALCDRHSCDTEVVDVGAWTVDDPEVASLRPAGPATGPMEPRARYTLAGLRAGRTRLQVTGLPSARDTMLSRDTVPRTVTREVVVTLPIARVTLSPRTLTAVAGEPVEMRVAVHDRAGGLVDDPPMALSTGSGSWIWPVSGVYRWTYHDPGTYTATVSFGGATDSVAVTVLPRPRR